MRLLILASRSEARGALAHELADAIGAALAVRSSLVDERAIEASSPTATPEELAVALAIAKARAVADHLDSGVHGDSASGRGRGERRVLGADQLLVVDGPDGPRLLHQPGTVERAVDQLLSLSGSTHRLVNGIAALDPEHDRVVTGIDVQHVTMRTISRPVAAAYVRAHLPLDCVGAYRLEDDAGLVASIEGEHRSGVLGLPLLCVGRLLGALGWADTERITGELSQSRRWTEANGW